ncbi:MAG: hypothetical protein D3915_15635, partial [Candidatus Electrothrix sp. AU1_5]|nr:hypothetical protein [Candidatus Electrothrix gigas]
QLYERAAHPDDYFLFLFQRNYSNRKISRYAPDNRKNRTFNRTRQPLENNSYLLLSKEPLLTYQYQRFSVFRERQNL